MCNPELQKGSSSSSSTTADGTSVTSRSLFSGHFPPLSEPHLLEPAVEAQGVKEIWEALTQEERDSVPDPLMTLRHFRAEKGKTEDAIRKVKNTLKWRKEFEVDKIIHCMDEDGDAEMRAVILQEASSGKMYVRGVDCDGRAALYMRPHLENTFDALNNMRHLVYCLERTIAVTKKHSHGLEKVNMMIDFEGFHVRDAPPMSTTKWTIQILQDHYPERLFRGYVLNAGIVFRTFFGVIRPFLDPATKEKVVMLHGVKYTRKVMGERWNLNEVEKCCGGDGSVRPFDHKVYLTEIPFDEGFC